MKPLDIGIASWQSPAKVDKAIHLLRKHTTGEFRILVVDNNSPDPKVREILHRHASRDPRVVPVLLEENVGYVGAVNKLFEIADTQYLAYCDNDAFVLTPGWNEKMMDILEKHHEIAMVFPESTGVAYPLKRTDYTECLWGVGCFWMINKIRATEVGGLDTTLGHQEEVDFQMQLRLNGYKMAVCNSIQVQHDGTSSANPEAQERIKNGIINWVNKWNKYFVGPDITYFSTNVTRFEDWPINAIYMEEWYKQHLPKLNANPETTKIDGREYDLIKVPRYPQLYRDRII